MNCELTANEIVKKNIGFYSIFWKRTDIIQVRKSRSACEFDRKKRPLGDHWKMQKHWKNNGFWPICFAKRAWLRGRRLLTDVETVQNEIAENIEKPIDF